METIFSHRSIRKFKPDAISPSVLNRILEAAIRASNTGNMQVYSIVVTTDPGLRAQLAQCHFNQPSAVEAPLHVTFCADINRFGKWCELRGAEPGYDNFLWFMNGAIDALLASQNFSLEAESHGLGICYLGTAVYSARRIAEILRLPKGVIPITVVMCGYPNQNPPLTDRLPLEGVVHFDTYKPYTDSDIEQIWSEREASEETANLLEINNLPNLARIFTEKRYTKKDNVAISQSYFELLKDQGFFNE